MCPWMCSVSMLGGMMRGGVPAGGVFGWLFRWDLEMPMPALPHCSRASLESSCWWTFIELCIEIWVRTVGFVAVLNTLVEAEGCLQSQACCLAPEPLQELWKWWMGSVGLVAVPFPPAPQKRGTAAVWWPPSEVARHRHSQLCRELGFGLAAGRAQWWWVLEHEKCR